MGKGRKWGLRRGINTLQTDFIVKWLDWKLLRRKLGCGLCHIQVRKEWKELLKQKEKNSCGYWCHERNGQRFWAHSVGVFFGHFLVDWLGAVLFVDGGKLCSSLSESGVSWIPRGKLYTKFFSLWERTVPFLHQTLSKREIKLVKRKFSWEQFLPSELYLWHLIFISPGRTQNLYMIWSVLSSDKILSSLEKRGT